MSAFILSLIIIQNVRLFVLASLDIHAPMLTTVNITVCYIIVLIASISILPRISLVGTCINIISMFLCHYLTDNSMYGQLLVIFGFTSIATTAFGFVANKLLREQQMELNDYASTIDQVLNVFNMRKSELLALLKLAKAQDTTTVYDKELLFVSLLLSEELKKQSISQKNELAYVFIRDFQYLCTDILKLYI